MFAKFFGQKEDHGDLKISNLDKFPSDIDKAKIRAQAYADSLTAKQIKLFSRNVQVNGEEVEEKYKKINNYSGKYIREESMSLWCENIDLYFLGSGYPMYFDFVKSCLIILFLIFVSSGSYNLFSNALMGSDCLTIFYHPTNTPNVPGQPEIEHGCQYSWTTILSFANKRNNADLVQLQDIMNFITVITIVFVLQYLRINQRALNEDCDGLLISPSDYTVWVQGVPKYEKSNEAIDQLIKKDISDQIHELYIKDNPKMADTFQIENVTVCYSLEEVTRLNTEKDQIIAKSQEYLKKGGQKEDEDFKTLIKELEDKQEEIMKLKKEYYDGSNFEHFTGHVFITLSTELAKNILIEEQDSNCFNICKKNKQLKLNGETIEILPAPEPTDVNWNTLGVSSRQQFINNIISDIATFFLLTVSFFIILGLMKLQSSAAEDYKKEHPKEPNVSLSVKIFALFISIVIPGLNFALQIFLTKLSLFEKHHRKTKEIASLGVKLAIAQFINTAVITFSIKVMFDLFDDRQKAEDNIYSASGLIYNQQFVFITNALISGASLLVDGGRIYKIFNRMFLAKYQYLTQRQINTLYEEPEHNLAFEYSGLQKTMLFTAFYAPLIPVGILFSMLGIMLLYFIQKYKILNHRTIRYSMSNLLSLEMIELTEYILPIYCLSNIVFSYILNQNSHISIFSALAVAIGIFNIFLPMNAINEFFFYVKPCPPLKEKYSENISNFQFDYDRANPATDDYARKLYVENEIKLHKQQF
ncbi:kinase domain protein (macronuclear) [Tetrahymena thermophila SB210]|uniref:Kinase domain protein n=1 Tax=Tetrahymena thermophila (strain SB210) TaxID=312017 RepID=Q22A09_TETTS|nr:kinase domain protein [Tetrahymena thermophila SB210]EAR82133.2 kinase domain protein [Tetrahymena thermophila SB210]|eukprot:XP_001029796.2 kinase domain protein [Tetrahymena thermophila SB210]